ncbi:MAG: D-aminoacylase [Candidatus Moraniibacteriota bacterium]
MYDILIKNGMVIDGSGVPMFRADVAVKEGKIAAVGILASETAELVYDADGCYVSPGFIDVNNHSDTYWELFRSPGLPGMLLQGVTTIVGGNSGASLAPLTRSEDIVAIQKWTDVAKVNFNWLSMSELLTEIGRRPLSVNFATLAGHGTIRRSVLKSPTKKPDASDIEKMKRLLDQALRDGAIGLSTGLKYTHSRLAEEAELSELFASVVREKMVHATYLRDEGEHLLDAVSEAIVSAKAAGMSLHISHLKAVGKRNWHLFEEALSSIRNAATDGLDITFDVYPYTASGSVLYTLLPDWVTESGRKTMLHRLKDFQVRQSVVRDMKANEYDYSEMRVSVSTLSKMVAQKNVSEMATARGVAPEEVVIDVLLASEGRAIVSLEVLSERNVEKAVQDPFSIISSNGVGYPIEHEATGDMVHPRNFGTFPRIFSQYVREKKLLSWEEAVHKMTGKPAAKFHFMDRGLLRENFQADIVVFDPDTIADRSTMEIPYLYPDGIRMVVVNGIVAAHGGVWTGSRSGQLILSKKRGPSFLFR